MNGVGVGAKRRRPTKLSSCQVRAQARRLSSSSMSHRFVKKGKMSTELRMETGCSSRVLNVGKRFHAVTRCEQ
jgi:hypothetical protein